MSLESVEPLKVTFKTTMYFLKSPSNNILVKQQNFQRKHNIVIKITTATECVLQVLITVPFSSSTLD